MIYNYQNGSQVDIGKFLGGNLDLFASPVYFDGTHNVSMISSIYFLC